MTGGDAAPEVDAGSEADRRATVRTPVERPGVVVASVRPDNTSQMRTRAQDDTVITEIVRNDTGGLRSTLDDYVVNLTVAIEVAQLADRHATHDT